MSYCSVGAVLDGGIVTEIPSVSVEQKVNGRKHKSASIDFFGTLMLLRVGRKLAS